MVYGFKGFKYRQISGPCPLLKLGIVWERHLLDPGAQQSGRNSCRDAAGGQEVMHGF